MSRESLRLAIVAAGRELAAAGVPSPQVDAELLAAHLLGVSRTRLGLTPLVESEWLPGYRALVAQRATRIPLQHLTGVAHLGAATVAVGPGVFTPRPETEVLLEWALRAVAEVPNPTVVDLCTGSGALALAIALARPDARVVAVERFGSALAWARRNIDAQIAGGGGPVELRGGDATDPELLADLLGTADLVVSNPPYVPVGTAVPPEVAEHDPVEAVFAGADGLAVIRPLSTVAVGLLRPGGSLAIEHDDSHADVVAALLSGRPLLTEVTDHIDLTGRPRFVTAVRAAAAAVDGEENFR